MRTTDAWLFIAVLARTEQVVLWPRTAPSLVAGRVGCAAASAGSGFPPASALRQPLEAGLRMAVVRWRFKLGA